jgi:hypothetical protein
MRRKQELTVIHAQQGTTSTHHAPIRRIQRKGITQREMQQPCMNEIIFVESSMQAIPAPSPGQMRLPIRQRLHLQHVPSLIPVADGSI